MFREGAKHHIFTREIKNTKNKTKTEHYMQTNQIQLNTPMAIDVHSKQQNNIQRKTSRIDKSKV